MASRIKGITVEIGGDTSGLEKSLSDVNNSIKKTQSQLRDVNNLLKLDPSNTVLLAQKQELLQAAIGDTERKLQALEQAQEAMDYIVTGTQNGLDKTNELGDNLSEYSGKFAQAGYSASEYFQLLQNGLQGGAYNLDKVNDAINEVTTRLADGTIGDSIDLYSQKTQSLFLAWQNGEATQKQVIDSIVADIANCTNEQQALNMAAEAFGTMAEDGNLRFITSLTSVGETYDSVAGSAQNLFNQTGTPMQEMEANTRKLQQALIPLGEKIVELANVVLPPLVAVIETVSGIFGMLPEPVQNFVVILGALLVAFTALVPIIAALAVSFGALNISLLPIIGIIAGVAAAIAAIIAIVKNWGAITEWFGQLWETVSAKLMELWDKVVVFFTETIPAAAQKFVDFFSAIPQWWSSLWSQVSAFFVNIWNNIRNTAAQVWNTIRQTAVDAANALKQGIQNIFSALSQFISQIWNTLKNTASNIWNGIKTTVVNIATGLKDAAVNAFKNLVSGIRSALSGLASVVQNGFSGAISFITSLPGKALQWGKDFIQGLINGIKSMVQAVVDTVSGIASKIASFLHFSAPDEGPLSDYEKWMPDFMKGLAGGIEKSRRLVEKAVKDVASDMVITPKAAVAGYGDTYGMMTGGSMSDMISGISSAVSEALSGFSGKQGNIMIPVYVGGTLLDELVVTAQARQNLRSGGR